VPQDGQDDNSSTKEKTPSTSDTETGHSRSKSDTGNADADFSEELIALANGDSDTSNPSNLSLPSRDPPIQPADITEDQDESPSAADGTDQNRSGRTSSQEECGADDQGDSGATSPDESDVIPSFTPPVDSSDSLLADTAELPDTHSDSPPDGTARPEAPQYDCPECDTCFDTPLAKSIHRVEVHETEAADIALAPGELEAATEATDSLLEFARYLGWQPPRATRVVGMSDEIEPDLGSTDSHHSRHLEFDDFDDSSSKTSSSETEGDTADTPSDSESSAASASEPDSESESPAADTHPDDRRGQRELSMPKAFTDHGTAGGNLRECGNCGSQLNPDFTRVMEPESESKARVCPHCDGKVRDGNSVREARTGTGSDL